METGGDRRGERQWRHGQSGEQKQRFEGDGRPSVTVMVAPMCIAFVKNMIVGLDVLLIYAHPKHSWTNPTTCKEDCSTLFRKLTRWHNYFAITIGSDIESTMRHDADGLPCLPRTPLHTVLR
jgi:hypothetical protein